MSYEVLVVDDEKDIRFAINTLLSDQNYIVREADTVKKALEEIKKKIPDLVILDVLLDEKDRDGIYVLKSIKEIHKNLPVIMISGHANIQIAVDSIKLGAFEFLEKPFNKDRLLNFIKRGIENSNLKQENFKLKKNLFFSNEIIGNSSQIVKLKQLIDKFSKAESRILISGPPGSGKELISRVIHQKSNRGDEAFGIVNGAILDPQHFDYELFGSEKDNLTNVGYFERNNRGTLLIDNIVDVPLETQGKILRVLSDQKFKRVGGNKEIVVDVRVISSTSKNLKDEVDKGNFREDLFHRINVILIETPYLKDIKDDIPLLIEINSKNIRFFDYHWPGNIRELRNLIERIVILASGNSDGVDKIISESLMLSSSKEIDTDSYEYPLKQAREKFEKNYLSIQLNRNNGNIQ
jgi:two-component system nitrogen regulation response regulator NtrX